jgi:hypothetical protein
MNHDVCCSYDHETGKCTGYRKDGTMIGTCIRRDRFRRCLIHGEPKPGRDIPSEKITNYNIKDKI